MATEFRRTAVSGLLRFWLRGRLGNRESPPAVKLGGLAGI